MSMIRCIKCGQFISYGSIDRGETTHRVINSISGSASQILFGISEYTCKKCNERMRIDYSDEESQFLLDVAIDIYKSRIKK